MVEKGTPIPAGATDDEVFSRTSVSFYRSQDAATQQAKRFPRLGNYVVAIDVPAESTITCRQTGPNPEHYDLNGASAEQLLALWQPPARKVK
jgi:hypothetical protein